MIGELDLTLQQKKLLNDFIPCFERKQNGTFEVNTDKFNSFFVGIGPKLSSNLRGYDRRTGPNPTKKIIKWFHTMLWTETKWHIWSQHW